MAVCILQEDPFFKARQETLEERGLKETWFRHLFNSSRNRERGRKDDDRWILPVVLEPVIEEAYYSVVEQEPARQSLDM
jgi:hypothetical protein